jgi:hypothetical protein
MHTTSLKLTAITNFVLSSVLCAVFGWQLSRTIIFLSPAGFWTMALFFLALSSFLGGIDDGVFEAAGNTRIRMAIQKATWISMAVFSGLLAETAILQFMPGELIPAASAIAAIYTVYYISCSYAVRAFKLVIYNYIPALAVFVILVLVNTAHFPGWGYVLGGMLLAIGSSAVQMSRTTLTSPFDHNCWYHVLMIPAVLLLARGGAGFNLF